MSVRPTRDSQRLAVGLAVAGVATAAISTGWIWVRLSSPDYPGPLWPFPGLYLVEAVALPTLVLWRAVAVRDSGPPVWVAIGALAAMGLLGAMTIGGRLVAALFFTIPASLVADGGRSTMVQKGTAAALGGALQAVLMIAVAAGLSARG